eukprot:147115-Rhodomonas_salina.1
MQAWLKAKGNHRHQERLAAILYSCLVQELLDCTLDVLQWPECPWLWVCVEVLCSILLLYEGVADSEAVDGNFVSDVSLLLAQVNDTIVLLVFQAAIIARMASLDTAEGKAWEKVHNKLIELCQETSTLTLDMVQQVVKLAENHLVHINTQ